MDKMTTHLVELSDSLDKAGNRKCANTIDKLIQNQSVTKIAQYVGIIGYVLKQNRAMGNCIRKKRIASNQSMQEVVLACLKEYQDGQEYGTNDWTTKYAQVIEDDPEQFERSHKDLLRVIAEENDLENHMKQIEEAHSQLTGEKVVDDLLTAATKDIWKLRELFKEGDAVRRPFKVAAPPSERSRWSRFWSPSWTRRGRDKDAQYEMDNVLESIMNVSSSVQQVKSNISRLRYTGRTIPNRSVVDNINGLSPTNWNDTVARMQNISQLLERHWGTDPDNPGLYQVADVLSDLSSNVQNVYNQISRIQRNMYNLRLRDAIKGRGNLPSATDEYVDLDRALARLYGNPLDEKALYYSQKLHGRLEDALNMRPRSGDSGYNEWVEQPTIAPDDIPGIGRPELPATEQGPLAEPGQSQEAIVRSIATNLAQLVTDEQGMVDQTAIGRFVGLLSSLLPTDVSPKSRESLNMLIDELQQQAIRQDPLQPPPESVQTSERRSVPHDPETFDQMDWRDIDFGEQRTSTADINIKTLKKMADGVEPLDADLAKLLSEYLQDLDERLPDFPETCPILKDEAASRLNLTQKKGGKVALGT
ncbi:MAG: hypothetical protein ACXAC5_03225 [Promethearchaeota archaeon]|jgi:hypothetical protein